MKKVRLLLAIAILFAGTSLMAQGNKIVSSNTHVKFFSSTPAEDIEANNYASVSTLNTATGEGVFSVPMQSFEFEKALMQKHFNNKKFLDTKQFPNAKLKGSIVNFSEVDLKKDGVYTAQIEGDLSLHGVTNKISETAKITVKGDNILVNSTFNITLADYGVEFLKGKPASNIAKTVEVTVKAEF